jgi:beta-N-acetylhexosaminidase
MSTTTMILGPVMGDVVGLALTDADRKRLMHPLMGGVILFARNYANPEQLKSLCAEIRALRSPHLMIVVDHEGGRVQRFREGFTTIPHMRALGLHWQKNPTEAKALSRDIGIVIGTEMVAHGLDFSFTPVLDLDWGGSTVIGARSFARDGNLVSELAGAMIQGLTDVGVASCAKHFPGHGFVKADSHHEIPIDERTFDDIANDDMVPFAKLAKQYTSVMPAHIIYKQVDSHPAGFSPVWLKLLRDKLGFEGVIFSDDLTMEGASVAGDDTQRAMAAFNAGCDMVLLCNDQARCDVLLQGLVEAGVVATAANSAHLTRMHAKKTLTLQDADYLRAKAAIAVLGTD